MKRAIIPLAAIAVLAGCGTTHAHTASSASPAMLSPLRACQALRADILANGGEADTVTLRRLLARLPVGGTAGPGGKLAGDIGLAASSVGTSLWPLDAARLASDCQPTG